MIPRRVPKEYQTDLHRLVLRLGGPSGAGHPFADADEAVLWGGEPRIGGAFRVRHVWMGQIHAGIGGLLLPKQESQQPHRFHGAVAGFLFSAVPSPGLEPGAYCLGGSRTTVQIPLFKPFPILQ